jgi:hypothetical protein
MSNFPKQHSQQVADLGNRLIGVISTIGLVLLVCLPAVQL